MSLNKGARANGLTITVNRGVARDRPPEGRPAERPRRGMHGGASSECGRWGQRSRGSAAGGGGRDGVAVRVGELAPRTAGPARAGKPDPGRAPAVFPGSFPSYFIDCPGVGGLRMPESDQPVQKRCPGIQCGVRHTLLAVPPGEISGILSVAVRITCPVPSSVSGIRSKVGMPRSGGRFANYRENDVN